MPRPCGPREVRQVEPPPVVADRRVDRVTIARVQLNPRQAGDRVLDLVTTQWLWVWVRSVKSLMVMHLLHQKVVSLKHGVSLKSSRLTTKLSNIRVKVTEMFIKREINGVKS